MITTINEWKKYVAKQKLADTYFPQQNENINDENDLKTIIRSALRRWEKNNEEKSEIQLDEIFNIFNKLPDNIPIYRGIQCDFEDIDYKNIGNYWSFDKKSALIFANNFENEEENIKNYLFSAKINKKDVNWKETIESCIRFNRKNFGIDNDENELTITKQNKIFDLKTLEVTQKKNKK